MKKLLTLTAVGAMFTQSLWGGVYQCQSPVIYSVQELEAFTSPMSAIRTLAGIDPYNNRGVRILLQGRCASNTDSGPYILEINQLELTTSTDPTNCWCQIIYPYFSQFVYLPVTLPVETTSACVDACSRECANKILEYGYIDMADYPPSEIIYMVEGL
ncbi:MAG: hypothetical protein IKB05_03120 [Alphaproteobacteria bacterium]|nr:hypothetical protein [Alphaproteobacteria bacterium]